MTFRVYDSFRILGTYTIAAGSFLMLKYSSIFDFLYYLVGIKPLSELSRLLLAHDCAIGFRGFRQYTINGHRKYAAAAQKKRKKNFLRRL
jgi:hypothetical protein